MFFTQNLTVYHFCLIRFSGLTADDMKGVTTTLNDVQTKLLSMVNDKTILIGHSLESDFIALKVYFIIILSYIDQDSNVDIICWPLFNINYLNELHVIFSCCTRL